MSRGCVWVNGSLSGRIDPFDRGLLLGDGVFDTATAFRRTPFAGALHLQRLVRQAEAIGLTVDPASVRAGWAAVLDAAECEHLVLRTTLTRGVAERGLWPAEAPEPTLVVSATRWSPALLGKASRLITGTITRNPGSPATRLKTLGYLDNILAAREAAEKGADDALFLTPSGHVSCTTVANVFAIIGDRLLTPPLADAVQPGIMRALVLQAAESAGLRCGERSLTAAELRAADAVFLTNSVRFLAPAVELDGSALGDTAAGKVAALFDVIAAAVVRECGVDPRAVASDDAAPR